MLFVLLFDHLLLPLFQCYVAVNMLLYFFFSNGYGNLGPRLGYGRIGRTHNLRHKRNCVIILYYTTYCIIYTGMYTYVCLWGKKNYIFYNHRTFHSNDTTSSLFYSQKNEERQAVKYLICIRIAEILHEQMLFDLMQ